MNLKDFVNAQLRYDFNQVAKDTELGDEIQALLVDLGMLEDISEGTFSVVAIAALKRFQHDYDCYEPDMLGPETASKLLESSTSTSRSATKPLVVRTLKETTFKQIPIGEDVKIVGVPKDKEVQIVFYEEVRGYLRLTLTYPLESMRVWYVWKEDVEVVADAPTGGDVIYPTQTPVSFALDVPYKSQADNRENPWGACNVTCLAMCMEFVKPAIKPKDGTQLEDKLYRYALNNGLSRHNPYDLTKIVQDHGIRDRFDKDASIEKVKAWISNGNPAVTHGWFTQQGHIIALIGYDKKGFLVHDPAGEWYSSGYVYNGLHSGTERGKSLHYSYNLISSKCIEKGNPDGEFLVHFISAK